MVMQAYRVQQIMERRNVSCDAAHDYLEMTDTGRRDFARNYSHRDTSDSRLFDLVLNVEKLGKEGAAHLIVDGLSSCGLVNPSL